jgi:hypothetical protein
MRRKRFQEVAVSSPPFLSSVRQPRDKPPFLDAWQSAEDPHILGGAIVISRFSSRFSFGWIDGIVKKIDEYYFAQRFSPVSEREETD